MHNFYLFLGVKLGVFGLIALIGILVIVAATTSRAVRAHRLSSGDNWILIAAAVSWCCYLMWSWTSPEIYDFRIAPIWGALIAASAKSGVTWRTSDRHPRGGGRG
jgi:O-antigen ligase